jgi:thiol-disulfide isomerase/thioredoxin
VPGPDLAAGWIGSEPLTSAALDGKVVVYDFWTYSCVNCVRTLPHLRAWYDRYEDEGLVIIGVHSPEFEFEEDPDNVRRAVDELGVDWPVALDPDLRIWDAFANQYWPAKYVVDRDGALRYVHFGEGAYDETEDVLRKLLGVADDAPRADEHDEAAATPGQSPELYLGSRRGPLPEGTDDFTVPDAQSDGSFALDGRWSVDGESATAVGDGAAIVLRYRGEEVNLVLAGSGSVRVSVDGGAVRTIDVAAADLVNLLQDGPEGDHTMRIEVDPGIAAYAFTFG